MKSISELLINKSFEHIITVDPNTWEHPVGKHLSVKIVMPCYCQAHCPFCFNNLTKYTQIHNFADFLSNLDKSLDKLFSIVNRPISLDITGNEPTYDIHLFKDFMNILRKYKSKADSIVLTTNGYNLDECLEYMEGIVDIVNISVHHYNSNIRTNIFNTILIPSNYELKNTIKKGKELGLSFTCACVLYKKFEDFKTFYDKFVEFAYNTGFNDIRFRCNYINNKSEYIDEIKNTEFKNKKLDELRALSVIHVKDERYNDYDVKIFMGVKDLTELVLCAEIILDDNGLLYVDYNKRYPVKDEHIQFFNKMYFLESL